MDTLNNKEMMVLTRLSLSYDRWASALKSGASAKQWLVENDRAEKIAGGAKKLAEADKVLADANVEGKRIVDDASIFADNIKTEAAVNSNKHTAALNERERTLEAQCAAADKLALSLDEQAVALDGREKSVKDRETAATGAETANGNNEAQLDAVQVRLANWEQTLNARDTRVTAAFNG
jgi:hypothetical protein